MSYDLRDDKYLENLLHDILHQYFPDLTIKNPIKIQFGRKCARRLGSISLKQRGGEGKYSLIRINGHFQNPEIPEYVIQATVTHELVHYLHGFNSDHEQRFRYPHQNGVVKREFVDRSLEKMLRLQKKWLKENWQNYLEKNHPITRRRRIKRRYLFKIKI